MAKKNRLQKKEEKKGKKEKLVGVAKTGASLLGFGGKKGTKGGKRRKKSALWYAKEVQRLKLKRKYDKEKMRI